MGILGSIFCFLLFPILRIARIFSIVTIHFIGGKKEIVMITNEVICHFILVSPASPVSLNHESVYCRAFWFLG